MVTFWTIVVHCTFWQHFFLFTFTWQLDVVTVSSQGKDSTLHTVLSTSFKRKLFYFFLGLTVFHRLYLKTPYCKSKHNNEDLWCFYWWFLWFLAVSQDISTYTTWTLQYDCNYFSFLAKTLQCVRKWRKEHFSVRMICKYCLQNYVFIRIMLFLVNSCTYL